METISRYSLVLLTLAIGCNGQDLIGPSPAIQAVMSGDSHTLTCSRITGSTSPVVWNDAVPGENIVPISIGSDITTVVPKYTDNFAIESSNADEFNLAISNIAVEDEGFYYCQLFSTGETSLTVTLTVEVQSSSMSMTQDGNPVDSSNPVIVTEGETSDIVCTSMGARPIVDILWYHQKKGDSDKVEITTRVTQTNTSNGDGTFNVVSTLQYTPGNNEYNDGTIRCESTGQLVATPVNADATLSVQYDPIVNVQYGDEEAVCSSEANPQVPLNGYADMQGYIFIVNNTQEYDPTECSDGRCILNLKVTSDTHVRCNATNAVGTGTDFTIAIPGAVITTTPKPTTPGKGTTKSGGEGDDSNVAAIVGAIVGVVLVIVIVGLLAYYFLVFKKKGNKTTNGGRDTELKPSNGSKKDKPVPAPRTNSKGDVYHDDEGKKANNDNTDGLHYADLDLRPQKGSQPTNNIIRTDEPTEYADVKTFIV